MGQVGPVSHFALKTFGMLALLMALGATLGAAEPSAAPIKVGVYTGTLGQEAAPANAVALDEYTKLVGQKPDIVLDYRNPTQPLLTPTEIGNLESRSEVPMVTWEPYKSGWSGDPITLQEVTDGDYDSYFRQAAQLARSLPFEVMIRFAHEMNGDWYPWSGEPSAYVAAWRHTVSIFKEEGATNVKWVWSPNIDNGYPFATYFPGEEWVDYAGLDGYNWGTAGVGDYGWHSLREVFGHSYDELTQLSRKPVILAETASGEQGGSKAEWIREGFLKTIPDDFPKVVAVVWFNTDKEEDWRVNSSESSLKAFREVVASPLYGGRTAEPAEPPGPTVQIESLSVTPSGVGHAAASPEPSAQRRSCRRKARLRVRYRLSRQAKVRIVVRSRTRRKARERRLRYSTDSSRRATSVQLGCLTRGRHLEPGGYSVSATAVDYRGRKRSRTRTARFRVGRRSGLAPAVSLG